MSFCKSPINKVLTNCKLKDTVIICKQELFYQEIYKIDLGNRNIYRKQDFRMGCFVAKNSFNLI